MKCFSWSFIFLVGCSASMDHIYNIVYDAGQEDSPETSVSNIVNDAGQNDACPAGEAPGAWGIPGRCDSTYLCTTINGSVCYVNGVYTGSSMSRCKPGTTVPDYCTLVYLSDSGALGQDVWCC